MLKILYCSLKNEYGHPEWGPATIDYQHFYGTLQKMEGLEVEHFAFDEEMRKFGRDKMNQLLLDRVLETKPDLLFTFLFTEEIKKETIEYITKHTKTKTLNWFADDNWRFPIFSRFWAPLYTAVATTDSLAIEKYKDIGVRAIKTQWAANTDIFKPQTEMKKGSDYEVTFVGKKYGKRGDYIKFLQKQKFNAQGYGKGWFLGIVDFQKMLEIYSFSKVNLNFSESPYIAAQDRIKAIAKLFVRKELGQYKFNMQNFVPSFQSLVQGQRRPIKTRTFEVPACGGFLLTGKPDDNLSEYYEVGKEIEVFETLDELREKCEYYLRHDEQRQAIAKAGYERTIKSHTYVHRFSEIFKQMELI